VTRVPGHADIQGNEDADHLARIASSEMFIGPELSWPVSHTVIKTAMRYWACRHNEKHWQSLKTCRQTKDMITGGCRRRERDLLALPRQMLRLVIGILTGRAPVQRHLIRTAILGTLSLHPNDIDCATVRDIVRFIRKSQSFQ